MKLPRIYRHYKNKFYKVLGTARHSETLEELVVYECLYENPSGKLWVRPKEMFEGGLEDGTPRFASLHVEERAFTIWPEEFHQRLLQLMEQVFPGLEESYLTSRLKEVTGIYLQVALSGEDVIGFKLGYEQDQDTFYSWLGAVSPEWRGRGLGLALMRAQHEWARAQGYKKIATKTKNIWQSMLILNIRQGFEIVRLGPAVKDGVDIFLEKRL